MMDALCGTVWGFKFPNDAAYALTIYGHPCTALKFSFLPPSNLGNNGKTDVYSEYHCLTLLSPHFKPQ